MRRVEKKIALEQSETAVELSYLALDQSETAVELSYLAVTLSKCGLEDYGSGPGLGADATGFTLA